MRCTQFEWNVFGNMDVVVIMIGDATEDVSVLGGSEGGEVLRHVRCVVVV